jgi:hypothetical protein
MLKQPVGERGARRELEKVPGCLRDTTWGSLSLCFPNLYLHQARFEIPPPLYPHPLPSATTPAKSLNIGLTHWTFLNIRQGRRLTVFSPMTFILSKEKQWLQNAKLHRLLHLS